MECCSGYDGLDQLSKDRLKTHEHTLYHHKSSSWFDLRVFYVRTSNFEVEDSIPEHLTLSYMPLGPNTIVKVNGGRSTAHSEGVNVTSQLRRDRVDKKTEQITFVNTDSIKMTGSVVFEVNDGDDLLLSGIMELCDDDNGFAGEAKCHNQKWNIKCKSHMLITRNLSKRMQYVGPVVLLPTVEVNVAGCFSGRPILLCKTLQLDSLDSPRKTPRKVALDSTPENGYSDLAGRDASSDALKLSDVTDFKLHDTNDYHYYNNSCYQKTADYMDGEDGGLPWFNAGVGVGVGLSLGICVGLGVGLLVRTYHGVSRNFKRRLL